MWATDYSSVRFAQGSPSEGDRGLRVRRQHLTDPPPPPADFGTPIVTKKNCKKSFKQRLSYNFNLKFTKKETLFLRDAQQYAATVCDSRLFSDWNYWTNVLLDGNNNFLNHAMRRFRLKIKKKKKTEISYRFSDILLKHTINSSRKQIVEFPTAVQI